MHQFFLVPLWLALIAAAIPFPAPQYLTIDKNFVITDKRETTEPPQTPQPQSQQQAQAQVPPPSTDQAQPRPQPQAPDQGWVSTDQQPPTQDVAGTQQAPPVAQPAPRDVSGYNGVVNSVVTALTILGAQKALEAKPQNRVKKWWARKGGQAYRKWSGAWNKYDREDCIAQKLKQLRALNKDVEVSTPPTRKTYSEWQRICSDRKLAEADKKKPYIGRMRAPNEPILRPKHIPGPLPPLQPQQGGQQNVRQMQPQYPPQSQAAQQNSPRTQAGQRVSSGKPYNGQRRGGVKFMMEEVAKSASHYLSKGLPSGGGSGTGAGARWTFGRLGPRAI